MEIEERVQVAIDNWAPRFLANGIDPNDLQRVTKRVSRWDDWSPAWSAYGAMHEQMGQEAEAQRHYQSAGYHYLHASMCYHFGKFMFVHKPDVLKEAHQRVVQTYQRGCPILISLANGWLFPMRQERPCMASCENPGTRPGRRSSF